MRRRIMGFIILALGILSVPFSCDAQHPGKVYRIGFLSAFSPPLPSAPSQGDRTILIIPLSWSRPEALRPVRQSWSQAHGLMPPCRSAWLSAPPHWRGHPARPQSAHLGSPPLVRRLGGGRREGAVRQDQ